MISTPLHLGRMTAGALTVARSGVRWLCPDGHLCQPGEVIAFCNMGLVSSTGSTPTDGPFLDEIRDFQAALAPRVAGRIRIAPSLSRGGYADQMNIATWTAETVIGHIETERPISAAEAELEVTLMTGRRVTRLAEVRSGLLTGWHDRSRAWQADQEGPFGTLLSLGICELLGVIRGERTAFHELLSAVEGPAQVVFVPDEVSVPNARTVIEQMLRTDDERAAIAADLAQALGQGPVTPTPGDWMFMGAALKALQQTPTLDRYDMLTRTGIQAAGPPDAVLMSLHAETPVLLRHRRLGYTFRMHDYRLKDAGPAVAAWLRAEFVRERYSVDDLKRDYGTLLDLLRERSPTTQLLICNTMSTSGFDDLQAYSAYDQPLSLSINSVRFRELNLMLHDLARERGIAIVDTDAIGAELGGGTSIRDGVHQDGAMQAALRDEILRILQARGVRGFAAKSPATQAARLARVS